MYENSRFLKNRFTFCGVNTNFGQQWAPPAYYHLTPIVSKGKHWVWYILFNIFSWFSFGMVLVGLREYSMGDSLDIWMEY